MTIQTSPRRWWVLGALVVAILTFGLDATVLNVALPTLARELDASTSQLQWFANSYTLALAATLLPAGLLGDRYGPKALLMAGLAVFGAASAWCALSTSPAMLIAARAVLGVGAAFMIPLSSAVLARVFAPAERGRALTLWTTAMALGIPLGPIVGGLLLQHFAWGAVFWMNVPLAVVGLVALGLFVPRLPGHGAGRLDLPGSLLSAGGLVVVTYGLVDVGVRGWDDARVIGLLAGGIALLALFVLQVRRAAYPLVDLGLFESRGFRWGSVLATIAPFPLMGVMFVLPQYSSAVLGSDALGSGLRLLPLIGGLLVGSRVAEQLRARRGAGVTAGSGLLLITAALALGATTSLGSGYLPVALWSAVTGAGLGFVLPVAMDIALGSLAPERAGAGSALTQALRQVGGTFAVALLGSVLNAGYRSRIDAAGLPPELAHGVRRSAEAGIAAAQHAPDLVGVVQDAFVHGMDLLLVCAALITAAGAVLAFRYLPRQADDVHLEPEPTEDGTMTV